jgi:hypothetical protein
MTAYDLVVKDARVVTHDYDDARPAGHRRQRRPDRRRSL